ncbi:arsenate reductase (glutaredoxin) [Microvirga sp. W0021]|uniref:Arsenate reductase n=1 Tax=Hohaiivirga grylli TaxID=3133970 RepID=A0ABV0BK20_9HYPH
METIIYHNPACGTSRKVLERLQNASVSLTVIEYLKTPLTKNDLHKLISHLSVPVRDIIRERGTPYDELGLDNDALTDDELVEAIAKHPILLNRPIVVSDKGAKLCRPAELVEELI